MAEGKISPAMLIVPVVGAVGLALVAGLAFARAAPPVEGAAGEILDITWWDGENYRFLTEPIPANTYITYRFRVKNTGNTVGTFKVGYSWYSDFTGEWIWTYSPSFNIEAGTEGNIDWELFSGPGKYTITFWLFSNDDDVDSVEVTMIVI